MGENLAEMVDRFQNGKRMYTKTDSSPETAVCYIKLGTVSATTPTSVGWRVDAHVYATIALVKTMGVRVLVQYTSMLGK